MKTKITYIGGLPDGHIEHNGARFKFERGNEIEVPEAVAVAMEYQAPEDWKTTPAVKAAAEARRKAEAEAAKPKQNPAAPAAEQPKGEKA